MFAKVPPTIWLMKFRGLIVAFIILICILPGCTKHEDSRQNHVMVNFLPYGKWVVTNFSQQGHEETSHFSGYVFKFNQNGRLMVSIAGVTITDIEGSWVELDNSKFVINLGQKDQTNAPLGGLSDDWVIISKSAKKFSLKDDNGNRNEVVEFSMQ